MKTKRLKTLHNAIIKILDNYGNSFMSFDDIANQVKKKDLWVRPSDGQYPEGYQIRLRTVVQKKNKHLFEERNGKIRLMKT